MVVEIIVVMVRLKQSILFKYIKFIKKYSKMCKAIYLKKELDIYNRIKIEIKIKKGRSGKRRNKKSGSYKLHVDWFERK